MQVIALTVLVSMALALFFIVMFVMSWKASANRCVEQDSLIPFDEPSSSDKETKNK